MDMSPKKWLIMCKIYLTNNKDYMTIRDLSKFIGVGNTDKAFIEVFNYLKNNNIINIVGRSGVSKFIQINHDILIELIQDTEHYAFILKLQDAMNLEIITKKKLAIHIS